MRAKIMNWFHCSLSDLCFAVNNPHRHLKRLETQLEAICRAQITPAVDTHPYDPWFV